MSRKTPLTVAYQALISRGRLQQNQGQTALVEQLSLLQDRLSRPKSLWRYDDNTDQRQQHRNGIYVYGGVGTGKSRIADLFATTLPQTVSHRRAHFFEFMTDMHMRLHRARSEPGYTGDPLIRIGQELQSESSVLCLDEFQVSDIADAMILKRLFGSFWDCGGTMVATSNRHPTELYKDGLNRPLFIPFIEELQRRCLVFRMPGDHDYRMDGSQQRLQTGHDIFYSDEKKFMQSLSTALEGADLRPLEIKVVMNRKFTVQGIQPDGSNSRAIVAASFSELCEASFGAADYHALCSITKTVYMSGLRKFAADELDIVRRFIMLVDVAYESRTRIICLSTASMLETFSNIVEPQSLLQTDENKDKIAEGTEFRVKKEGGSSSSMMSTFIGAMEWSATGLKEASLATGGAGEKDVRFAIARALSRLTEMGSSTYGSQD